MGYGILSIYIARRMLLGMSPPYSYHKELRRCIDAFSRCESEYGIDNIQRKVIINALLSLP